jgi:hypothetical protein
MKFKLKKSQLREMILEEIRSIREGELDAGPLAAKEQLLQAFGAGEKERVPDDDRVGELRDMIVLRTDEDVAKALELKDVIEGDFDWFIQLLSPSAEAAQGAKGYIRWDWRDM